MCLLTKSAKNSCGSVPGDKCISLNFWGGLCTLVTPADWSGASTTAAIYQVLDLSNQIKLGCRTNSDRISAYWLLKTRCCLFLNVFISLRCDFWLAGSLDNLSTFLCQCYVYHLLLYCYPLFSVFPAIVLEYLYFLFCPGACLTKCVKRSVHASSHFSSYVYVHFTLLPLWRRYAESPLLFCFDATFHDNK